MDPWTRMHVIGDFHLTSQVKLKDVISHNVYGLHGLDMGTQTISRAQKYLAPVAGNVPTNVPTMYPWQGKMGENGGKWGENGRKWGKIGKNKETWVVQPVPGVQA